MFERIGEALAQRLGEIALQFAGKIRVVRHVGRQQIVVQLELGIGEQDRKLGPG